MCIDYSIGLEKKIGLLDVTELWQFNGKHL